LNTSSTGMPSYRFLTVSFRMASASMNSDRPSPAATMVALEHFVDGDAVVQVLDRFLQDGFGVDELGQAFAG
ncbi:hypothetical protein CTI14_71350, partial [Methylobacterium radiotolerans]